jgi:3-phenylpropionate/trans-cinnamate dioxygenase ferredoxin subunit
MNDNWIQVCPTDAIAPEDVIRFDHGDRTFAIYRTDDDKYYATDGHCTHAQVHLADGLVMGTLIECPKHNGRFDFCTGAAKRMPVTINLRTYPVKIENGTIFINIVG